MRADKQILLGRYLKRRRRWWKQRNHICDFSRCKKVFSPKFCLKHIDFDSVVKNTKVAKSICLRQNLGQYHTLTAPSPQIGAIGFHHLLTLAKYMEDEFVIYGRDLGIRSEDFYLLRIYLEIFEKTKTFKSY